ncbi:MULTISPECIES: hydroxyisourate hydrolase [unclassified Paenibacillus]|uniref:hydroxyisourate hydrolase n=1 Tax=unclassified Paenibacillus TaxID=185978 RepID=UPI000955E044|nr:MULTISPECIES: hydroxyisourate hydrolase [unclassified Paenibacillus]ASS66829.1 hydroxyisourate hydrolase [Paenibacillus sp. RUD330]SIP94174.1 5-hydroxyisourate hydrolase [Paenibacillus sp. RU4X]SIQ12625.1 5-hydroxyisourate hydrolase [Paenibacillus sp. RU4T]
MEGKLTTHVLDMAHGGPAAGMKLQLARLEGAGGKGIIRENATNVDGRLDQPLLEGEALTPGIYELLFFAGDYFRSLERSAQGLEEGTGAAGERFLEQIPIRFTVTASGGNYHVPLLVAPGGYSSYRGS